MHLALLAPLASAQETAPPDSAAAAPPSPRILVLVPERIEDRWFWFYYTDEAHHVAQNAIEKALLEAGMPLVDLSAVDAFTGSGTVQQLSSADFAVEKAKEMYATHVITGLATADKASESAAYGVNVVRVSAEITAKLIRVRDGKVLAVEDAGAQEGGQAVVAVARQALKKAGEAIGSKLARQTKAALEAETPAAPAAP
jgi:hypothetical protein